MVVELRIEAPHYVAGIQVNGDGWVVEAAPITRWMVGKLWKEVRDWLGNKGYRWEQIG